jgi:outer membrane protein assembly factor BamB
MIPDSAIHFLRPTFPIPAASSLSMKHLGLIIALVVVSPLIAEDWPQFRGPKSDGHYTGPKLPTQWGTDTNVVWKTAIPGHGWSSPIVWKGKIYLTTAVKSGDNYSLQAVCVDTKSGKIDWQKEVFIEDTSAVRQPHAKNSHASPTPVTDGQRLYVHFGHMGTAALDLSGNILWAKNQLKYNPIHGNGGSPILAGDNVIFSIDGLDMQVVVALKKSNGEVAWKTDRKSTAPKAFSFSTPLLIKVGDREQVVSPASGFVAAYDPNGGAELWRAKYPTPGYSVIPQPVAGHGFVYVSTSYDSPQLLAIKPPVRGNVEPSWALKKGAPHTPTHLLVGDELYSVADSGLFTCMNAKTGEVYYSERLNGAFSSSPIHADGKIYLTNETGAGYVLAAGKEFKEISKNDLKEKTFATFAAVDGALFIRTEKHLYRFEEKAR